MSAIAQKATPREFFIRANSYAAPFFSDPSACYQKATTPRRALAAFRRRYRHPCGLFAAAAWGSADDYHKGKSPLARWLSKDAQKADQRGLGGLEQ